MAIWSKLGLSGPAAGAGVAVVVLVVAGGYLIFSNQSEIDEAAQPTKVVEDTQAPRVAPSPEPDANTSVVSETTVEPDAEPQKEVEPEAQTTAAAAAPKIEEPTEPVFDPPAFDVVQVQPDGGGVIAGRAVPGRPVVFYLDGEEISRAVADRSGKFGLVLDFPASDAPRSLTMASVLDDGSELASDGTLLISPVRRPEPELVDVAEELPKAEEPAPVDVAEELPKAEEPAPAETLVTEAASEDTEPVAEEQVAALAAAAAPDPAPEAKLEEEAELTQEAPEVAADPEVTAAPEPEATELPDAPAVVLATEDSVKIIQPAPQPAAPQIQDAPVVANVVIDTITYDSSGDVALSGRGASDGFVRVYLNDQPIKTSQIEDDGSWQAPLPDIDAGVYRLRVDEVAADGSVTSRVETPFQREEPEVVATSNPGPQAVTVQPGFTLWAIAKDKFGAGDQYVRVYEANRDLIRDPDLIYPGQVFAIPEG